MPKPFIDSLKHRLRDMYEAYQDNPHAFTIRIENAASYALKNMFFPVGSLYAINRSNLPEKEKEMMDTVLVAGCFVGTVVAEIWSAWHRSKKLINTNEQGLGQHPHAHDGVVEHKSTLKPGAYNDTMELILNAGIGFKQAVTWVSIYKFLQKMCSEEPELGELLGALTATLLTAGSLLLERIPLWDKNDLAYKDAPSGSLVWKGMKWGMLATSGMMYYPTIALVAKAVDSALKTEDILTYGGQSPVQLAVGSLGLISLFDLKGKILDHKLHALKQLYSQVHGIGGHLKLVDEWALLMAMTNGAVTYMTTNQIFSTFFPNMSPGWEKFLVCLMTGFNTTHKYIMHADPLVTDNHELVSPGSGGSAVSPTSPDYEPVAGSPLGDVHRPGFTNISLIDELEEPSSPSVIILPKPKSFDIHENKPKSQSTSPKREFDIPNSMAFRVSPSATRSSGSPHGGGSNFFPPSTPDLVSPRLRVLQNQGKKKGTDSKEGQGKEENKNKKPHTLGINKG